MKDGDAAVLVADRLRVVTLGPDRDVLLGVLPGPETAEKGG
jgi:hypothetical protein